MAKLPPEVIRMLSEARSSLSLKTITHYTSLEGFRSIIADSQVWVSNIRFLNDKREMDYGIREAVKFLEQLEKSTGTDDARKKLFAAAKRRINAHGIPDAFACCFCEHGDSLGQWRGYSNGTQGVAIDFQAEDLRRHFLPYGIELAKVVYGQDETRRELQERLEKFISTNEGNKDLFRDLVDQQSEALEDLIISLAPRFKHKSFEDEREWRIIVKTPLQAVTVEYRTRDNVLVPFIKLGSSNLALPIEAVRVGPGKDMDITKQSVEMFLKSTEHYEGVIVEKSNVPFRT